MNKLILTIAAILLLGSSIAYAAPYFRQEATLVPISNNAYDLGTSSLRWRNIFMSGNDGCVTLTSGLLTSTGSACGTGSGGGGSGGGTWSTTTSTHSGRLINYPNNDTDIVSIGSNSTTTSEFWFDPNTSFGALTGSLGVGTTSSSGGFKLDVYGSNSSGLRVMSTDTPGAFSGAGIQGVMSSSPTAANQRLGFYTLGSFIGASQTNSVGLVGFSEEVWGAGSAGSYLSFETTAPGSTSRAEKVRILGGGNVGIGTTSPYAKLSVVGQTVAEYFTATSTTAISRFPLASTTVISAGTICLTADSCRTAWPTSGSGASFPFTTTSYGGVTVNSTSTPIWFTATTPYSIIASSSLVNLASTTIITSSIASTTLGIIDTDLRFTNPSGSSIVNNTPGGSLSISTSNVSSGGINTGNINITGGNNGIGSPRTMGSINLTGGGCSGCGGAIPGNVNIIGGQADTNTGGSVNVTGGAGTNSHAGSVAITGGAAATASMNGGNITIGGGTANTAANNGSVIFTNGGAERVRLSGTTGFLGIGTTSPYAPLSVVGETVASHFTGTTTATSTFGGNLNIRGTGTTTSAGGFNLSAGCYAINNTCISGAGGGGSGTVNSGTQYQAAYYESTGTAVSGTSTLTIRDGKVGIATSTPSAALDVYGDINVTPAGSANSSFLLKGRTNAGIPVPYFVPNTSAANSYIALDLVVKGTPTNATNYGVSWMDITDSNESDISSNIYEALRVGKNKNDWGYVSTAGGATLGEGGTGVARNLVLQHIGGNVGVATTSPRNTLTVASTTAPQLALSASAGVPQWTMRNAGGNLYLAPTNVAGTATSSTLFTVLGSGNVGIGTTSPYAKLAVTGQTVAEYFTATSTTASSTFPLLESGRALFGDARPNYTDSSVKAEVWGNTNGAVQFGVGNKSNGTAAYNCIFQNNDAANALITAYAAMCLNSSQYNDTTFGTAMATPYQWSIENSMTSIANFVSTTSSLGTFDVYTQGRNNENLRLRISNAGNVGIGTSSPYAKLSVVGPVVSEYFHATSTTATSTFANAINVGSGSSKLVVDYSGNVGVGTSTPWLAFSSVGRVGLSSTLGTATGGSNHAACINSSTYELLRETTSVCTVSSAKFKKDIKPLGVKALDLIKKLNPITYSYKEDTSSDYKDTKYGFIAEEVANVDPHFAEYGTDGNPRTLDDRAIISTLVKAVQEQQVEIEALKKEIKELKN